MKKRVLIILFILAAVISATTAYLNLKVLPTRIKALIVDGLEEATQKKVILGSVSLNIFKGFVLRDLLIYDGNIAIFSSREISCIFLIPPIFKKEIIIPYITIKSPELFVRRSADGSVNIIDLFKRPILLKKSGFRILIYKIDLKGGRVSFHDDMLDPPFLKEIRGLDLKLAVSLPKTVKFDLEAEVSSNEPIRLDLSGEYDIERRELTAASNIKGLPPRDFESYFILLRNSNGNVGIASQELFLRSSTGVKGRRAKENNNAAFPTLEGKVDVRASLKYDLTQKALTYHGNVHIDTLDISGVPAIGDIEHVKGDITFSDSALSSDNISALAFGVPLKAQIEIADLKDPSLDVSFTSEVGLASLQRILRDDFAIHLPAAVKGDGKIYVKLRYDLPEARLISLNGSLDIVDAAASIGKDRPSLEDIAGMLDFTSNQVKWQDLTFKCMDKVYVTTGVLTNFEAPGIRMALNSERLSLDTVFAVNDRLLTFSKFAGKYHNSEFSMTGGMDLSEGPEWYGDIKGVADIEPGDLKERFKNFKGRLHAEFSLKGNFRDLRSCTIEAGVSSGRLSIYDFKFSDIAMSYIQRNGVADIRDLRAHFYGGEIRAAGTMELMTEDMPYSAKADIEGLRIEQLKADTAFRDKDISGRLRAKAGISGASNDISRLEGRGSISIADGRLWQLNLFRGLGILLFSRDFSNIVFSEGRCDFLINNSSVLTDDLSLKSDLIYMYGAIKLGFDKTIEAALKVQIQEDAVESSAAVRNVTTAIGKYSFIEITGTLKEPKYKIRPDVADILEDVVSVFF